MRSCQSRRMSVILQKIPNIFIVRVCILCIVERRKSWSIHIFNNILLAYYCVLFLAGWLLYMYTYKNSCRILCISYVHFIWTIASTVTEDAICIVTYCYPFVIIPIHTYWYDVVCLCCGTTLGILICRVATKPAQSIHSLYLPSAPRHIILINTLINSF